MSDAKVTQKIVFTGTLQLDSPLVIGSGTETETRTNEADIHVLKDKQERPFIPGTSLAGVLRDWFEHLDPVATKTLFGFVTKNENTMNDVQSAVSISDVVLANSEIIVRDGVSIDVYSGTGIKGAKYDFEAVERGAKGKFLMIVTVREYQERLIPDLDTLIRKLADRICSGFSAGALTTKGMGLVSVPDVTVNYYDFRNKNSVANWLLKKASNKQYQGKVCAAGSEDTFIADGEFALKTSLLVRNQNADESDGDTSINAVPMKSKEAYLIPGTSLKGVLRHHALKILSEIGKPDSLMDELMGFSTKKASKKSRFSVNEVYFKEGVKEASQTRNRIDRFTGGTIESALFTNRALWQGKNGVPVLKIHFEVADCHDWEAGLALFLLKDLWTGKIAIGGEKSIGRGLLTGCSAVVMFKGKRYVINENGKVSEGDREELERLAAALVNKKEAAEA